MLLLRLYTFALIAACLAIQPVAAGPTASPGQGTSQLLHFAHGWHGDCVDGHRHGPGGLVVPCVDDDDDDGPDDDDDGPDDDDGSDDEVCVQVGPVQVCD